MKNCNGLSGSQRHQLNMFIENNRELAATESDSRCAEKASELLGFRITSSNVSGARRAVGIEKKRILSSAGSKNGAASYVALAVVNLYRELNMEIPPIILKIARRQRMEVEE